MTTTKAPKNASTTRTSAATTDSRSSILARALLHLASSFLGGSNSSKRKGYAGATTPTPGIDNFCIVHTPDRPVRPVLASEAPSDGEIMQLLEELQRQAANQEEQEYKDRLDRYEDNNTPATVDINFYLTLARWRRGICSCCYAAIIQAAPRNRDRDRCNTCGHSYVCYRERDHRSSALPPTPSKIHALVYNSSSQPLSDDDNRRANMIPSSVAQCEVRHTPDRRQQRILADMPSWPHYHVAFTMRALTPSRVLAKGSISDVMNRRPRQLQEEETAQALLDLVREYEDDPANIYGEEPAEAVGAIIVVY